MSHIPQLQRSTSIHYYNQNASSSSDEDEVTCYQQTSPAELDNIINQHLAEDPDGYSQVMQIGVPFIYSQFTYSGIGVININKSLKSNIFYIYMPINGAVYTMPIDSTRTFAHLLDYILYFTPEFVNLGEGEKYEFVLEGCVLPDNSGFCEEPDSEARANFLQLPLDKITLSVGTIFRAE